jgi:ribosome-associated heat shock protein Hsp15
MADKAPLERLRLDKWLWAARLYKTRALAAEEVTLGRVDVNGQPAKPARELKAGDMLAIRQGPVRRELQLYAETPASVAAREAAAARRRMGVEPADSLAHGRPTKRDRRQIADWNRWSASADDPE